MKLSRIIGLSLSFFFMVLPLFAASVTNEGKKAVRLSGKSATGVMGSLTIPPGKTLPFRQKFLWIEHIPENATEKVSLKIIDDSGALGYITVPGGRYVFQNNRSSGPDGAPVAKLRPGYALNASNVQMYITLTNRMGSQKTSVLMPSQTMTVPEDTTEIKTEPFNNSFGDQVIQVEIVMPDGKRHTVRSANATVRLA